MKTLYGMSASGNCWKPAALMRMLGIDYRWVETDILKGDTRTPEFLLRNPNGKVPLLEFEPGRYLAESNAMLLYFAENTPYLPRDAYLRAKCTSGCSSSSTAMSRTSPRCATGCTLHAVPTAMRHRLPSACRAATRPWGCSTSVWIRCRIWSAMRSLSRTSRCMPTHMWPTRPAWSSPVIRPWRAGCGAVRLALKTG